MQAVQSNSTGGAGDTSGKSHDRSGSASDNIGESIGPFRAQDWVRRWVANGNLVAVTSHGLYLGYDMRPSRSARAEERWRLERELTHRAGASRVLAFMSRLGSRQIGVTA